MSVPGRSLGASHPVLRVQGLGCTYASDRHRVVALRDVSFELRQAERLAIVGESGAGKSTLLRCLNLLVRPTHGSVEVDGQVLTSLGHKELTLARHHIGMIFQHFALLHRRTIRENVALPLELAGVPRAKISQRVDSLLERVRLLDKADAYPAQLSGGQRQRVGIARALAHSPRVLLCDEPTSALDAETARHVVALLDELSKELNLTLVFVTHQLELVRALADVVAVLDGGALSELTPITQFLAQPRSAAGRRLLTPEAQMKLPHHLVDEARRHAGVGPSTLLTFAISSTDATSTIFQMLFRYPQLHVDVVGANIESTRGHSTGSLSLLVHGAPAVIQEAIAAFEQQTIPVEVVGHVRSAA
ncbi:ATP-binding cassette domain-containing protein [Corallococcus sp. c25j21]|nr:ATP-binding cassette domain-containing protein [Corallococcus silvisoli]